ncbi:hypothetical protein JOD02_002135 [Caldicoprobacter guelmensis]|uniref:DUF4446 family protein n=1 Tax=Caldicoprobacter guelmensis TaxID=1170224 RepID=UPI0019585CBA|nr:DUF4446 family protein [Caldicoprobacter guelmensis]MBM7583254.1 hypothetical protein [Caldicoprobacter guelmensis]
MDLYVIVEKYNLLITGISAGLAILAFLIVIVYSIKTRKIIRKYKRLMRGVDNKNLEALLMHYLDRVKNNELKIQDLEYLYKNIEKELESCIQRVGIIRYNPFEQMGSDLSFSIAFLDKNNNGVVLTGLFTRNSSSIYAKPIEKGTSIYPLSQEEVEAINRAINKSSIVKTK